MNQQQLITWIPTASRLPKPKGIESYLVTVLLNDNEDKPIVCMFDYVGDGVWRDNDSQTATEPDGTHLILPNDTSERVLAWATKPHHYEEET